MDNMHCKAGEAIFKIIREENPEILPLVYRALLIFSWAELSLHDVMEILQEIDPSLKDGCSVRLLKRYPPVACLLCQCEP